MRALFSIKPEYVKKIFNGEKKYEYRKTIFKLNIDTIVVYSTMPEGKIVGELKIEKIIVDKPEKLWNLTKEYSGTSYLFFKNYFKDKKEGYAIKIKEAILYDCPIDPKKLYKNFKAPQSFYYIKEAYFN